MVEEIERNFTIPLTVTKQVPRVKRTPRSIKEIKEFVRRHMEEPLPPGEEDEETRRDVWIDYRLNEYLWSNGIESPPSKVRVKAIRFEDGLIEVSLPEE